ncbi:MAG: DUF7482 domain-containing protein [Candidatus Limnocylindria bacterium]
MSRLLTPEQLMTRRRVLQLASVGVAGTALAACAPGASAPTAGRSPLASPSPAGQKIVGDTLDFTLAPDGRWEGPFGSVTLRLHKGSFDGEDVHFIRTDASEQAFANENGLVFVPLMASMLNAPGSFGDLYLFGDDAEPPVFSTVPDRPEYTPAFRVHRVTGTAKDLRSVQAVKDAESQGTAEVEMTNVFVNYPLVRWPDSGLAADPDLAEPLGKGPLIEEPDLSGGEVTFKLHECFPGSRYIVTDTSAVPMAPMMGVVGSGPTQMLKEVGATAPITIFLNGLEGPGVMGFQPAIFNTNAGEPAWSPFWDHFAVQWNDPAMARVVRSQQELEELVSAGELERFNGLPDTHPNGFVVNCPSPVLAPTTFTGS